LNEHSVARGDATLQD